MEEYIDDILNNWVEFDDDVDGDDFSEI